MASAVDIITYVGVPLAVLGVLPTLYTCLKSLVTLRTIRKTLDQNGVIAITRSSLLSGIVEIEIPRKSITPLDRHDPPYFDLAPNPSQLKGGTWTTFNWKEMVIGVKAYRLQYHDELSQPQAEVEFEQLVAFLLDRGAVPSVAGFKDLRSSGLWTPAGTKLLLSPTTSDAVLMVGTSDDSDGILSLCVQWKREWDRRSFDSLPPYWIKLQSNDYTPEILSALRARETDKKEEEDEKPGDSEESTLLDLPSAYRLRIGSDGIDEAYNEDEPKTRLSLPHLHSRAPENEPCIWFASASTALGAPKAALWSFVIPDDIRALARRDTIPCGVMVLLEIMTDEQVPAWRTEHDSREDELERDVQMGERSRAMMAELRLPPEQRQAAAMARMQREHVDWVNRGRRQALREQQRREQTVTEAMTSQRLPIAAVGEGCRKWLVKRNVVPESMSLAAVVEQLLFCMIHDQGVAARLGGMLDRWRHWTDSGGLTKVQFEELQSEVMVFACAAVVIAFIKNASSDPVANVVSDLQECIRMWRKVRLG